MSLETTERLAVELARHATPVRPIPRLRVAGARVLATAAVGAALFLAWMAAHAGLGDPARLGWVFAALLSGLGLVGAGATVAALGLSVPGRETAVRAGLAAAALGTLVSLAGVPALRVALAGPALDGGLAADLTCLASAVAVAALPAGAVLWFVSGAAPHRPGLVALVASAGAAGLGAMAVPVACPYDDLRHLMLGHALAPAFGGLVLALPLGLVLRRLRRA